jgi:hypothetical protein
MKVTLIFSTPAVPPLRDRKYEARLIRMLKGADIEIENRDGALPEHIHGLWKKLVAEIGAKEAN